MTGIQKKMIAQKFNLNDCIFFHFVFSRLNLTKYALKLPKIIDKYQK